MSRFARGSCPIQRAIEHPLRQPLVIAVDVADRYNGRARSSSHNDRIHNAGATVTTVLIRCSKCKTEYRIKNAEEMEGKKVLCKKCRAPISIRLPRSQAAEEPAEDEFGTGDAFDDEFASPGMRAPAPLPMKRAKKKPGTLRNPSATADEKKLGQGQGAKAAAPKNTAVFFVVLGIGLVILTGMGIGGVLLLRGGGSAKYVAPADNEYTEFRPQNCGISCKAPKNWSTDWGGGTGGQPYWARLGDDRLKIEVRESISGGAMAQAAIAMQQKMDPGGRDESLSPAQQVHEAQEKRFAENYKEYHEQPARKIRTQFGEGRISDFSATEGLIKSTVVGCRTTMFNTTHQFTVSFKCSPSMFKDAKPVFEKVVASMGAGSGP